MSHHTTEIAEDVAAPQQLRSRRSMERVIATAERLMEKRTFDQIPVNEIIRRSRVSTGAFYARFGSKSGLFSEMVRRYQRDVWKRLEEVTGQIVGSELEIRLRGFASAMIGLILRDKGRIRGYLMHIRAHPSEFSVRELDKSRMPLTVGVAELLLRGAVDAASCDEQEVIFVIQSLLSVVREQVLFNDYTLSNADDPELSALASNLAAMAAAYLNRNENTKTTARES